MLMILVGFVIALMWWNFTFKVESRGIVSTMIRAISPSLFIVCIILGISAPSGGYQDPILSRTIELTKLSEDLTTEGDSRVYYVFESLDNIYSYKYEVKDKNGFKEEKYKVVEYVDKNVTEIESDECKKPVLNVYEIKPKITWITFGLGKKKTKYVFYVPTGTIKREFELK